MNATTTTTMHISKEECIRCLMCNKLNNCSFRCACMCECGNASKRDFWVQEKRLKSCTLVCAVLCITFVCLHRIPVLHWCSVYEHVNDYFLSLYGLHFHRCVSGQDPLWRANVLHVQLNEWVKISWDRTHTNKIFFVLFYEIGFLTWK